MTTNLRDDYAACLKIARSHYENFPVASLFLPRRLRPHVAAVYAFARLADDFADEEADRKRRLRSLAGLRRGLTRALASRPLPASDETVALRAVAASVKGGFVPAPELFRLLDAFDHDARDRGYADMRGLLAYCRNSACSIGRILLHLFRVKDPRAYRASDALCSALQLTNFWQDFSRDLPRKRLTLPRREARRFRVSLVHRTLRPGPAFEELLAHLIGRTRLLYRQSEAFADLVPSTLARQIRVTRAGGLLVLERTADLGSHVLRLRPRLGWRDAPGLILSAFR